MVMIFGEAVNTEICLNSPCMSDMRHLYCQRCVLVARNITAPGMSAREIEQHFTAIGRTRALTEKESVVLEYAIRNIEASERSARRRLARAA